MDSLLQHQFVKANNVTLHVVQAGPATGPLVILPHGFPEFWYGWRNQIDFLASADFRVWAPDQRGYNLSDKPKGIAAYNLDELAADVIGLIDAAGCGKAFLIGHAWGAAVAWWVATKYPQRLERLVILNVPHHAVMRRALQRNFAQLRKSWYIFFFQIPGLINIVARCNNWQMVVKHMRGSARSDTFSDAGIEMYRTAWSQPSAFTSMVNWYRAVLQKQPKPLPSPRINVPTLLIWGAQDKFLGREMAQPSIDRCDHGRLVFLEMATHWVQHEEPDRVYELIREFFES